MDSQLGKIDMNKTNSLTETHPRTATLWHSEKNKKKLSEVTAGMGIKVWWKGKCGHEWERIVGNQTKTENKEGCIYCSGRAVLEGFNDLATTHPELAEEWHPENKKKATEVRAGSGLEPIWLCSEKHIYKASLYSRTGVNRTGCPYCSGRLPIKGENDLLTINPLIASEWHPNKNKGITPSDVLPRSNRKIWWVCLEGHEWKTEVNNRTVGKGCSVCSNNVIVPGINDAATANPVLAKWFASDLNDNKEILNEVTDKSNIVLWWRCPEDDEHTFSRSVRNHTYSSRCPVCSVGRSTVISGVNDLTTRRPDLMKEWDWEKNSIDPTTIRQGTELKVWWRCLDDDRHSYQTSVHLKNNRTSGCPICSNRKIVRELNSLEALHPDTSKTWHPELNGAITPGCVGAGSIAKAWWVCEKCEHIYEKAILQKVLYPECPKCGTNKSAGEQQLKLFIAELLGDKEEIVYNSRSVIAGYELDIYLPQKGIAIEFNGIYWHSESVRPNKNYHKEKWSAAKEKGVQLIQIWEDEWMFRQETVKSMLTHKLGLSELPTVYARKTLATAISYAEAVDFLNDYHIQGAASGSFYAALKTIDGGDVVAVLVLKRTGGSEGVYSIERYATSQRVVGGFSKLLKYVEAVAEPSKIVTFSDNCISDGKLYLNTGFTKEADVRPDYKYTKNNMRYHKFGFRLDKFRNDPNLKFEEGLTESELARLNNMHRIWDAGKVRWVRKLIVVESKNEALC